MIWQSQGILANERAQPVTELVQLETHESSVKPQPSLNSDTLEALIPATIQHQRDVSQMMIELPEQENSGHR